MSSPVDSTSPRAQLSQLNQRLKNIPHFLPYLALIIGAISMGTSGILVKWANAPGAVSGFYRMLFAALLFSLPFGVEVRRQPVRVGRALWFTLLAGLLFAGDLAVWNTAVLMTSAANATFIGNTAPVWVSLGAWLFFRERPSPLFWLGLLVALVGAGIMLGGGGQTDSQAMLGGGLALIAGIFYAGFFLATRVARSGLSAFASWWISASVSAGALFISSLVLGQPLWGYPANTWLSLLGLALITQAGAYLLVNYALGHLPAPIVSTTLLLQPVATLLLAIPFLNEWPTPLDLVGGALVLAGVWVVNRFGKTD